jgi:phage-related baseplate assembly protein
MQLQLQNFSTLVSNAAAAVQGSARQLLDLTVGSTLRAILEANAAIGLWMQWLILQVLATTRAATSTGTDLDTWTADFSLARLPASPATGQATFSRFTPATAALIQAGVSVRTSDGSQTFTVGTDTTNPAWNATSAGYTLGSGVASIILPITATTPGAAGNVQAGAITLLATAIPGIDMVTNAAPLAGGLDAEGDTALRTRFSSYLDSRARATPLAIGAAILSVRQGLNYTLQENLTPTGTTSMGCFVVTVDDGSGAPSAALLASVAAAVEAMRPIGSLYTIQPPTVVIANVSMAITTAPTAMHTTIAANVARSLTTALNTLTLGAPLPYTRLAQLAYAADPNVTNVTALTLNGGTLDLTPNAASLIKAGTIQVN